MAERGLTDGDRQWLEGHFRDIREESKKQWDFSTRLDTELKLHIQASNSKHDAPCATAQEEMKAHLKAKHNPAAKMKTIGIWAGTTAAMAEAIHWLHEIFKKG